MVDEETIVKVIKFLPNNGLLENPILLRVIGFGIVTMGALRSATVQRVLVVGLTYRKLVLEVV